MFTSAIRYVVGFVACYLMMLMYTDPNNKKEAVMRQSEQRLTIEQSIADPDIIYIGRARAGKTTQGLMSRLADKITDHLKNILAPYSGRHLDSASKAAVDAGCRLEVCWATAQDDTGASAYESALICRYKATYGHLPGFTSPVERKFYPGNKQTPREKGPVATLSWSPWEPMDIGTLAHLPKKPGVYRIRAVPPEP